MLRPIAHALIVALVLVSSVARADQAGDRVVEIIERWLAAQNSGDFAAYAALYAESFHGVRRTEQRKFEFDRAGWLEDRERFFRRPMHVAAAGIEVIALGNGSLSATFTQRWESGSYHEVGSKRMEISDVQGSLRIAREELQSATRVPSLAAHECGHQCNARTPAASMRREVEECRLACIDSASDCPAYADVIAGGRCGVSADAARAIEIVEEACKRNERTACLGAAQLLVARNGAGDLDRAIELRDRFCKSEGECWEREELAKLLVQRGTKDDQARALRLYLAICGAAELPVDPTEYSDPLRDYFSAAYGCGHAAEMYQKGLGAPVDEKRARTLFRRSERLMKEGAKPHCCKED